MIDREKLTYDLALQYAAANCLSVMQKTRNPGEICENMVEDFAIAHKAISDLGDKYFKHLLHEDE